jgi:hypothetical protein
MPAGRAENGESAGDSVDVESLFRQLREEVRRSGSDPGAASGGEDERRSLRLRPGVRGGIGTPVKAVLRKLMRWYVEPVAYDQRSFNAASLRLIDDLQQQVDALRAEVEALRAQRP